MCKKNDPLNYRKVQACKFIEPLDFEPLEKVESMPKFTILGKNIFLINPKWPISNMTIGFSNSSPKIPK